MAAVLSVTIKARNTIKDAAARGRETIKGGSVRGRQAGREGGKEAE